MSNQIWTLFVPKQAVGANKDYFDLFNASGGTHKIEVSSIIPVVSGAVAVTGVVSVDLFLTKTSAIGTTGTAATLQGTSLTAATFSTVTPPPGVMPTGITARLTPGGGATTGAVLRWTTVFTEETNAGTYINKEMVNQNIILPNGVGLKVIQGGVASVGNIGFNVTFGLIEL